jgi:hypothetical protein
MTASQEIDKQNGLRSDVHFLYGFEESDMVLKQG